MLFEKKTKWIVLATYNNSGNDNIVFVRRSLKSGMLEFKTKRVTPYAQCSYNFQGKELVNIKDQFDLITQST